MNLAEFFYCVLLKPVWLRRTANAFLRLAIPARLRLGEAVVHLNPEDPVVSGALRFGVYEPDERCFFLREFKSGMNFVDVGANVGLYSALAIKNGASGILAVEPHAESFNFLEKTIRANHPACPVYLEACAVGGRQGRSVLYAHPDNKGDNRLYKDSLLSRLGEVDVETLDRLCYRHGIGRIDFLKMDVQGWEMQVWQGAQEILEKSPDCITMTEFWPEGIRRSGSDPQRYLDLLSSSGRRISLLKRGRPVPVDLAVLLRQTRDRQYHNLVVTPASISL